MCLSFEQIDRILCHLESHVIENAIVLHFYDTNAQRTPCSPLKTSTKWCKREMLHEVTLFILNFKYDQYFTHFYGYFLKTLA